MPIPSFGLTLRALSVPLVILKIAIQYYTVGTVYTRTDAEFEGSLFKNIALASIVHLSPGVTSSDVDLLPKLSLIIEKFRGLSVAKDLPHYGEPVTEDQDLTWVVRPKQAKKVLLYLHGGGYTMPLATQQFIGIIAVWYAVDAEKREDLAVAVLDYSLSSRKKYYPTQIFEAVAAYRKLSDLGYEVIPFGDSAGGNLALALARFTAYPEEAKAQFSPYTEFEWNFLGLTPPRLLVLIAPWVQVTNGSQVYPGANHKGDLIRPKLNTKGDLYITGLDKQKVAPFVDFNETSFEDHWAAIPAFTTPEAVLYIYGEREHLRGSQEKFAEANGKKFNTLMHPGGIHDAMFAAEVLGMSFAQGQKDILAGKQRKKFNFGAVAQFLDKHL